MNTPSLALFLYLPHAYRPLDHHQFSCAQHNCSGRKHDDRAKAETSMVGGNTICDDVLQYCTGVLKETDVSEVYPEAARCSETLVPYPKTKWRHNHKDLDRSIIAVKTSNLENCPLFETFVTSKMPSRRLSMCLQHCNYLSFKKWGMESHKSFCMKENRTRS